MAATKTDPQAAKEAKQKKILIVLGIVLLALLAFQLPKLMGGGNSTPAATPATTTTAATDAAATPTPTGTTTVVVATPADLTTAGAGARPKASEAQLASFSLFKTKDPFVQKIVEKSATAAGTAPAGSATPADSGGATAPGGVTAPDKPAPVVYGYATLSLNGESEPVTTKALFPADDPMFQVVAIGKNQIKIGIAGGKLSNGKAAVIKLGKSLTLVNDATGARYVIKLLYTGTEAEPTATFTAPNADPSTASDGTTTTP